jgi:pyruvate, water dikinase
MADGTTRYIRWFSDIGAGDVSLVGGKNASLGTMYRELAPKGVRVPNGFAITVDAYRAMMDAVVAWDVLHELLNDIDKDDIEEFIRRSQQARETVYNAGLPQDLQQEILQAYHELQNQYGQDVSVAVRSSATAEDLPTASFAGQHESYLNVQGDEMLLDACRHCFASLFTGRAVAYRIDQGFDHFKVFLSIGVMKMVRSDLAASGVMFSLDTESGYRDAVFLTGSYGLGENIVKGTVDPDEFYVHKPTFQIGHRAVLKHALGTKQIKMVLAGRKIGETTKNVEVEKADQVRFCISDQDVLILADYAIKTEDYYSELAGHPMPMDMEWAKDGKDGQLYLVQARPETVVSQRSSTQLEEYILKGSGKVLTTGRSIGFKIATGPAHVILDSEQLSEFKAGEVLVTDTTTPDWGPVMKTAAAVVTNHGGRTCHAAIVARELGIPAVVGTGNATEIINSGRSVTLSCAEGDVGKVYDGAIPYEISRIDIDSVERPTTRVMINIANPELAFKVCQFPNDGVGLARTEFIIGEHIGVHPMALIHPEKVLDAKEQSSIEKVVSAYTNSGDFFIEKLSEGIGMIAAAFYPKPVMVRLSDYKTNEYASLLGGRCFEPKEANPMLGFRGAFRYTHPDYAEAFTLECAALKRAREIMGLNNIKILVPFCRTVEEGRRVLKVMERNGLCRGENGLEIHMMCEIPGNVIQIDAYSELFDGFSIGSNDLTQLTLGVDRDSDIVAAEFNERDPGVKEMIRLAVEGAKRNGRAIGFCGQAPSDYPEIAEYLVSLGIDSISLNPDTVLKTTLDILQAEKHSEH